MPQAMIAFGRCGDPDCELHHMTVIFIEDDGTELEPKTIALPMSVWVTVAEGIMMKAGDMPHKFEIN